MKSEIKRAIVNKHFIFICTLGILFSVLHCYQVLISYNNFLIERERIINASDVQYNPLAETVSIFTMWIGFDRTNIFAKIFFILLPIISVASYCWSYCSDLKNGYAKKLINQIGAYRYHLNKYISIFVSSGLVVAIPLIANFMIMLLFVPAIKPDSVYDIYYGIFSNNFMADAFYNMPVVYIITFIFINFTFCGLFGCVGYAVSTGVKSKIVSIVSPIVLVIVIEVLNKHLLGTTPTFKTIFSPLSFMYPIKSFESSWKIIISEALIIFSTTFLTAVLRFKFNDIKRNDYDKEK